MQHPNKTLHPVRRVELVLLTREDTAQDVMDALSAFWANFDGELWRERLEVSKPEETGDVIAAREFLYQLEFEQEFDAENEE